MGPTSDFRDNDKLLFVYGQRFHDGTEVAWYMPLHLYRQRNFEPLVTLQIKIYECQQLMLFFAAKMI